MCAERIIMVIPTRFYISANEMDNEDDDDYLFNIEDEEKVHPKCNSSKCDTGNITLGANFILSLYFQSVRIGYEYQAAVPVGLCRYDDALPYENEDKLLWDPKKLSEEETERYLNKVRELKLLNKKNDCKKNEGKRMPPTILRERKRSRPGDPIATKDNEQVSIFVL